ncbi:MAG: rhamnan synthesis F family protein [Hyphomicrobiales bacterium]
MNIAVVTNTSLPEITRRDILDNAQLFIEREDVGRDFGGYKDAIEILFARNERIDQLILANDSVYYLPNEARPLIERALTCRGFGAITESRQTRHHAQSFFLVFAPRVHESEAFRRFWRNYRPIHTRHYAIRKGEFGLTRTLTKAGFAVEAFYTVDQLADALAKLPDAELERLVDYLPLSNRRAVRSSIARGTLPLAAIIDEVRHRNPAHAAAFLFLRTTGFPVLKRNLYKKRKYQFQELQGILCATINAYAVELADDMRRGAFYPARSLVSIK